MMRKLLYTGIAAAIALAVTSGLYLKSQKQYTERTSVDSSEPISMKWAKMDLRTGEYNPAAAMEAKTKIQNSVSRAGELGLEFISRGPDNVGGRTRSIIEIYGKPDTLLAGSVTGGLWVSYNGGATWQAHEQFNNLDSSSSIISAIHQDTNSGKIYIGTGSSFDDNATSVSVSWPGFGMYVSDDEGETFDHITSTTPDPRLSTAGNPNNPWIAINRIRTNADGHIFAATHRGLYFSTDDGDTWANPIYVDQNFEIPFVSDACADIVVTTNDRYLVSFAGGRVYLSDNGEDASFELINDNGLLSAASRTCLAVSPTDPDVMYVLMNVNPNACLGGIYKSTDGGESFTRLLERHDDFSPMQGGADYCQGVYDAAIGVDPRDPNTIFIGGVEIWRYDGSLTRIASEGGSPPVQDVLPFYVHADKHYFYFSPNEKRRMYVTTDGGISKTENRGETWQGLNKGYITTQFYGITHFNGGGGIIGGTQDNGTLVVLGENTNDPMIGYQVFGNDGIDCDASQNIPVVFASSQNGLVVRADVSAGTESQPGIAFVSGMGSSNIFLTVVKLYENLDDPTSQDSIIFENTTTEQAIATGNGILKTFNESVSPVQPAAEIVRSSIRLESGELVVTIDPSDEETLIGDGEGDITFNNDNSIDINVTFDNPPAENANVILYFDESYDANDVLILESGNLKSLQGSYTFEHRLENSLEPGDVLIVQEPVQSYLLSTGGNTWGGTLRMYRNVLNSQELIPNGIGIPGAGGSATCIEISDDGNVAFVGTSNGAVYRIVGLSEVYTQDDADTKLSSSNILQGTGFNGPVTGIAIDRNDNNRLVITGGGYGRNNRVAYIENALSNPTYTNVHGDLAAMPIYDAEFNINDPNMVLIGTEFGLWATGDITESSVTWSDENDEMTYVPVYDIRQQYLPFERASNTGMIYVGTHGRGFWESGSLVGVPEYDDTPASEKSIADFKVYPNPVQEEGRISLDAGFNGLVNMTIYDINGRQVKSWQERVAKGNNTFRFNTNGLRTGSYFAIMDADGNRQTTKFMVMK